MDLLLLALGWLFYAGLHSLLAALAVKAWVTQRWPAAAPFYRLAYNVFAGLSLLPLLWAIYALPGAPLWRWTGAGAWLANGLALAALVGFYLSTRHYDMDEFLGLKPWRERRRDAVEHDGLYISPFHRHVRHPWYSFGLVLIWTRDMNAPFLVSAIAMTLYFILAARLEEKKLAAHFGAAYQEYCRRVPGLVPVPWKRLSPAAAEDLMQQARQRSVG